MTPDEQEPRKDRGLLPWLLALGIIHVWMAFGIHGFAFPDEWYQSLELASLLWRKQATYSQEIGLHLRNLTWPAMLTLPLRLAEWLKPGDIALRFGLAHAFAGLLDLLKVWGAWQFLRRYAGGRTLHLGMALLFLPHFYWVEGIRLHGEHLSSIALWIALGFWARGWWIAFGAACVATAAFRYPSGLFGAGLLAGLLWQGKRTELKRALIGVVCGLVLFGWADAVYYGRPWESLWMYLQYNVLTDLSAKNFGTASAMEYLQFLKWHWVRMGFNLPIAIAVLIGFGRGLPRFIRGREPWLLATGLYLAGHLAIAHKEQRFMIPLEGLLLFGGWAGALTWLPYLSSWNPRRQRALKWGGGALLLANLLAALPQIAIGDRFKYTGGLFELEDTALEFKACAVITERMLPTLAVPSRVPLGAYLGGSLVWYDRPPKCGPSDRALVYLPATYRDRILLHCKLVNEKRWHSSLWASCDQAQLAGLLGSETRASVEHPAAVSFGRIEKLPGFGITGTELVGVGQKASPPALCANLCFAIKGAL